MLIYKSPQMYSVKVCKFYLPGACSCKSWLFPGASIIISFTPPDQPPTSMACGCVPGFSKNRPQINPVSVTRATSN